MARQRYSATPSQIIKTALAHAIDEREGLIDAYADIEKNTNQNVEVVRRARRQVADYKLMLKRRYGSP